MNKGFYILLISLGLLQFTQAQDIHFSQIHQVPTYLNPAKTGLFDYEYINYSLRLNSSFRQQWKSIISDQLGIPKPYNTFYINADGNISRLPILNHDILGYGLSFMNDQAGDLNFEQNQFNISFAYHKSLDYSNHFISLGTNIQLNTKKFNLHNATFDKQWDGTNYNSSYTNNEYSLGQNINYTDFGIGLGYWYCPKEENKIHSTFSLSHINKPNQSFNIEGYKSSLPRLLQGSIETLFPFANNKLIYLPNLYYYHQSTNSAFTHFQQIRFQTENNKYHQLSAGIRLTNKHNNSNTTDAYILAYKISIKNTNFGISYDYNISNLQPATNSRGAIEFSLQYYIGYKEKASNKHHRNKLSCPKGDPVIERIFKLNWKRN